MSEEQPNYYAIIPANVRYSNITPNAKLLYGEITALANMNGYCYAGNDYFAKLYNLKRKETVSDWIKVLSDHGFIRIEHERKGVKIRRRKIYINPGAKDLQRKNVVTNNEKTLQPTTKKRKENITFNTTSNNNATTTADSQNSNSELKDKFTNVLTFYQQNIGVLNPITAEDIVYWCNDLSPEVVTEAIRRTAQSNKNWRYATAILRDWVKHNIRTLDQIQASDVEFQKKNEVKYSNYKKPKKEGKEDGARW